MGWFKQKLEYRRQRQALDYYKRAPYYKLSNFLEFLQNVGVIEKSNTRILVLGLFRYKMYDVAMKKYRTDKE